MVDDPDALLAYLEQAGIGCRRFFLPIHRQPCYEWPGDYPNAERAYERGLSLPSSPLLSEDQIRYVCNRIAEFMRTRH
jgi:perosamine synthetase